MRDVYCAQRVAAAALLAVLLTACSGGGGTPSAASQSRVAFPADSTRTVFKDGVVEFRISPPLEEGERALCRVGDSVPEPCTVNGEASSFPYTDLAPGQHTFRVELDSDSTAGATVWEHVIERVEPAVVVFGATPAGITAAVAAARANQTAALIEPTEWVGGMMSAGLTKTDMGTYGHHTITGIADEFFRRVSDLERRDGRDCSDLCLSIYDFAPQAAERVFESMLDEAGVVVERGARLLDVAKSGTELIALVTSRGGVSGRVFIDASYEGDLMAHAEIDHRLGREARGDSSQIADLEDHAGTPRYRLPLGTYVDPFNAPGDPTSGTLPYIESTPSPIPTTGQGDSRVMAYTYRLCVTDDPSNRIPFTPPAGYDAWEYEAHARLALALRDRGIDLVERMFNPSPTALSSDRTYYKYDLNGGSTFSSDMTAPDMNQAYVEASEDQRERIRAAYRRYIQGMLWTWQTDPRFGALNEKVAKFGYCKDEFVDRGGWPHQLYVRIARRMVGEYVMNENDIMQNGRRPPVGDSVGLGAYGVDMHTYRYFAGPVDWPDGTRRGAIVLEGFMMEPLPDHRPYRISYRSLVPKRENATNLLNPVTLSATNVAMSSIRMEPTMMMLGQAAGTAAALAIELGQNVQDVSYQALRDRLLQAGQRVEY